MSIKFISIILLLLMPGLSAFAQTRHEPCHVIRKVAYPVTQIRADQKLRIALLNLCPSNPGMVARPMLPIMENGQLIQREYDIAKVFRNAASAKKYAKEHNIKDISF